MLFETLLMLLDPVIIFSIFAGVSAGLFVGAMPGLTATMALAVLLPFTFTLPPLHGLVALGAVYMGAIYGGSFAAILVNTPGTPSSIATAFEGYPMSKQGRALEALSLATVSSAVGGIACALFLLLLSPPLARLSLRFGPSEYFWVAILGLTLIASLSEGSSMKGMMGGAFGMIIGTLGVAPIGGETRIDLEYVHWADEDADFTIDDSEVLLALERIEFAKELALDPVDLRRLWGAGEYRWDGEEKRFHPLRDR